MKTIQTFLTTSLLAGAIALGLGGPARAADAQRTFASPDAAAAALIDAAKATDARALDAILGPSWQTTIGSGDAATDAAAVKTFVAKYERMHRWTTMTDGREVLLVGADNYPYPIPLAKAGSTWRFDADAGEREMAMRRLGANELLALDAVDVIAGAEEAYFARATDGEIAAYAEDIVSADGKRNGLYFVVAQSEQPSPLAELGEVVADRATLKNPLVLDGYTFRILTAQGEGTEGGATSYVKNGAMTEGYAVLATPVDYGRSGVLSFLRGRDGVVYEKDLGEATAEVAASIQAYEPRDGWQPVE